MNSLAFLGIALVIAVVGGLVVLVVHRGGGGGAPADGVDEFQRIMHALAPEERDGAAQPPGPPGDDR